MNRRQRIAVILIFLAILILVISLFVRAAVNVVEEKNNSDSVNSEAKVKLTVLPPRDFDDRRKGPDEVR